MSSQVRRPEGMKPGNKEAPRGDKSTNRVHKGGDVSFVARSPRKKYSERKSAVIGVSRGPSPLLRACTSLCIC